MPLARNRLGGALWRASLWSVATSGWGRDRSGAESPTEGVSAVPTAAYLMYFQREGGVVPHLV